MAETIKLFYSSIELHANDKFSPPPRPPVPISLSLPDSLSAHLHNVMWIEATARLLIDIDNLIYMPNTKNNEAKAQQID